MEISHGPEGRWIEANGVRLYLSDWGGRDEAIIFAHPTGFLGAVWGAVIRALRRKGCSSRIFTYDQRGHGLSSKPDKQYEWLNFAHDLEALLDELGIEQVLGVGHSAGATSCALASARNPRRFRRLVLIDPVLFDPELAELIRAAGANPMAERTRTRRLVWRSRQELFDSFRKRAPYNTWLDEALWDYVNYGTFERPDGEIELLCPGRIEAQVYQQASATDAFPYLAKLAVPVLFVRGERSETFPVERARLACETTPGARLLTVDGTSHFVPQEKPERIADLIIAEQSA